MGCLQKTWGAVTSSFKVLKIYNGKKYSANKVRKDKIYSIIQEFSTKFKSIHGTIDCKSLLNAIKKTEEGHKKMKDNRLSELICE